MTKAQLRKTVRAVIMPIRGTSVEMARALQRRRIKGQRFHGSNDPIANLLRKKLPALRNVYNHVFEVRFTDAAGTTWAYKLPKRFMHFIRDFDNKRYPQLVGYMRFSAAKRKTKRKTK